MLCRFTTVESQRDILEKSCLIFLRQGCHWWRLGLVPGHVESQYVAVQHPWFTKPNSLVYLDLLKMIFYFSQWEIPLFGEFKKGRK